MRKKYAFPEQTLLNACCALITERATRDPGGGRGTWPHGAHPLPPLLAYLLLICLSDSLPVGVSVSGHIHSIAMGSDELGAGVREVPLWADASVRFKG